VFLRESIKAVKRSYLLRGSTKRKALSERMNKKTKAIIVFCMILLIIYAVFITVMETSLNSELIQKNSEIAKLNNQLIELQNQMDNQQKAYLVTSLGISTEPRNVTYPHPHFTIEGIVINVGNKTAYNASLDIIAYYKNGILALNMSIPFGNLAKWETGHVNEIIATSDWIENYTVTPTWIDAP
jgi:hypothetical protein